VLKPKPNNLSKNAHKNIKPRAILKIPKTTFKFLVIGENKKLIIDC